LVRKKKNQAFVLVYRTCFQKDLEFVTKSLKVNYPIYLLEKIWSIKDLQTHWSCAILFLIYNINKLWNWPLIFVKKTQFVEFIELELKSIQCMQLTLISYEILYDYWQSYEINLLTIWCLILDPSTLKRAKFDITTAFFG